MLPLRLEEHPCCLTSPLGLHRSPRHSVHFFRCLIRFDLRPLAPTFFVFGLPLPCWPNYRSLWVRCGGSLSGLVFSTTVPFESLLRAHWSRFPVGPTFDSVPLFLSARPLASSFRSTAAPCLAFSQVVSHPSSLASCLDSSLPPSFSMVSRGLTSPIAEASGISVEGSSLHPTLFGLSSWVDSLFALIVLDRFCLPHTSWFRL